MYFNIFFPPNKISSSDPSASIFNTSILLILLLMQKLSKVSVLILCEEKPLFKFKLSNFLLKFHNLSSLAIVFKDEPDDGKNHLNNNLELLLCLIVLIYYIQNQIFSNLD